MKQREDMIVNPFQHYPFRQYLKWIRDNPDYVDTCKCFVASNKNDDMDYRIILSRFIRRKKDVYSIDAELNYRVDADKINDYFRLLNNLTHQSLYVPEGIGVRMESYAKESCLVVCFSTNAIKRNVKDVSLTLLSLCVITNVLIKSACRVFFDQRNNHMEQIRGGDKDRIVCYKNNHKHSLEREVQS